MAKTGSGGTGEQGSGDPSQGAGNQQDGPGEQVAMERGLLLDLSTQLEGLVQMANWQVVLLKDVRSKIQEAMGE